MATLTLEFASFDNGAVVVEYDINDANWRVSKVRCINNSAYVAVGRIYEAGELVFSAVAPAGETTSWNVTGVQLGWQEPYWNDITEQWEEAGIEMGDYVFNAQWPGEV
jgi:hypothetical protein